MTGTLSTSPNSSVPALLRERFKITDDMSPGDWAGLREGMLKWIREEEREEIDRRSAFDDEDQLATDPPVSEAQRRAMYAAAEGKSNLGIPKKVGQEFVGADADFNESDHPRAPDGKFGSGSGSSGGGSSSSNVGKGYREPAPGGGGISVPSKPGSKSAYDMPNGGSISVQRKADGSFYGEVNSDDGDFDFEAKNEDELRAKLTKWKAKHAGYDSALATDSALALALDRDTVREKRKDGQLVVKRAHITKANICPYRGEEIPGWEELGLDRNAIYNLLRDPEELKKAAPSLNGVQLLRKHIPVNAEDHQPHDTVGSLGTDAEYVEDGGENYLDNSLFINAADAIEGIESGKKRELSAGYHYTPDMTPGNFRGTRYDGVMRDIVFNHVALVEDGRAGPDVVVGDSMENLMGKPTKLGVHVLALTATRIAPLIAMDQKVTLPADLVGLFKGLTTKNIGATKAKLLAGVKLALDGKTRKGMAMDGPLEHLKAAVDAYEELAGPKADEPAAEEKVEDTIEPIEGEIEGKVFDGGEAAEFLRGKGLGEDDIKTVCDMFPKNGLGKDEDDEEAKKKAAEGEGREKKEGAMDKTAMDAALKAQAETFQKQLKDQRDAERGVRVAISTVRDWVGDLPATMAFDSAADVYRHTLTMKGVADAKTLHNDALLPILKTLPKIGAKTQAAIDSSIAMDSTSDSFKLARELAPGLANISAV